MNQDFIIEKIHRVILVGKTEYTEKITTFTGDLEHNELIFHISGKSITKFNNKILKCDENNVHFLPQGPNNGYTLERITPSECLVIYFDTNTPISEEAFVLKTPNNSTIIASLFKKIFSVWVSKNEGYYFKCISLIYEIFSELQKQKYISNDQYNAIKPAINYINENFLKSKISMPYLTKICGISESYLKKLFIKKFGMSPVKYIIQLKINYASDLLHSGRYTISQTAELCGYNDTHFFSRQFKNYIGLSPSAFINKYKSSK